MNELDTINWVKELPKFVSSVTLQRGKIYFKQGKVLNFEATMTEREMLGMTSEVSGSVGQFYRQDIVLGLKGGKSVIDGECSCPVGYNCKHVVAAIYHYQQTRASHSSPLKDRSLQWLQSLDEKRLTALDPVHPFFVYILVVDSHGKLSISIYKTRQGKRGGLIKGTQVSPDSMLRNQHYDYTDVQLLPIDIEIGEILQSVSAEPHHYYYSYAAEIELQGVVAYAVLEKVVKTGRLFLFEHQQSSPFKWGDSRPLQCQWKQDKNGNSRLDIQTQPAARLLQTEPVLYLDNLKNEIGKVHDLPCEPTLLPKLLEMPPVDKRFANEFSQKLVLEYPEIRIPPPKAVNIREVTDTDCVPHLLLLGGVAGDEQLIHLIRLQFDYDDVSVVTRQIEAVSVVKKGQDYVRVHRQIEQEKAAIAKLTELGFIDVSLQGQNGLFFLPEADTAIGIAEKWALFIEQGKSELENQGWLIETDDSFLLDFQNADSWDADFESSGSDWFDMRFDITVNGQSMPLLPLIMPVLEYYERDDLPELLTIPLEQHRYVKIPSEQIKPFLDVLYELYDSISFNEDGTGRLSRYNAAAIADLDEHNYGLFSLKGAEELLEIGRKLKDFKGITAAPLPQGLKATLRNYQQLGLNWLQFLREYRFAGILADDMGLGKTVQVLTHLLLEKESGRMDKPCLVVAPTSLMGNWRREAERFTPDLNVLVLQGAGRKSRFFEIATHDLVLTTYPLLPRDENKLMAEDYYYLILDEAQVIKNPKAQASKIVRRFNARHRLSMTGTPMENHLGELWAQFDFLMPGFLGDSASFTKHFRTPIEKHGDAVLREKLAKRVKPFMLRRTKQEVVDELPEKTEIIRSVVLDKKQAALYESIRVAMEKKVRQTIAEKGLARSHITILDALLKLRQSCCDPRLLSLQQAKKIKQSAKLDMLMDMLAELLEEGRRILIFSQFTKMLALIETELKQHKISYSKLTGQTRKRDEAIDKFKQGDVDVFLISLKAGGVGLNLTEADTVIIYDPWWNPAVESQAADRVYRIGQDKAVFVYKLITENTVEEKIIAMQEKKRALAEGVYQQGQKAEALDLNEALLTELFKPIGD